MTNTVKKSSPIYIVGAGLFGPVLAERIAAVLQR